MPSSTPGRLVPTAHVHSNHFQPVKQHGRSPLLHLCLRRFVLASALLLQGVHCNPYPFPDITSAVAFSSTLSTSSSDPSSTETLLPAHAICGTDQAPPALVEAHKAFQQREDEERVANYDAAGQGGNAYSRLVVQVFIHWVTTYDQASNYPANVRASVIQNQMAALNIAYRPLNVAFHYNASGSSYTIRDEWATDQASVQMKQRLRRGTYQDLNIYFQSNLSANGNTLLGYCTLPSNVTYDSGVPGWGPQEVPAEEYATDGCDVLVASMPGVPNAIFGYNQGKTAVHEVGHWFGLLHTFQDVTCDPQDPGDYISDTPQERVPTSGCPQGKDTCPDLPGLDPINNYMDYSTDQCYTEFTTLQMQRMRNMFDAFRRGW